MFKYALDVINEDSFSENNWTKLHEEDRFYNWYHGYTLIYSTFNDHDGLNIFIYTSATSGVVTSQHYGEKFMPELVDKKLYFSVRVSPPESVLYNENVTLHLKVEKLSMTGLPSGSKDEVYMDAYLDAEQTTVYKNFTPPGEYKHVSLSRDVTFEEIETQRLDLMPGFKFSWWYTGIEVTADNRYAYKEGTKQFVR